MRVAIKVALVVAATSLNQGFGQGTVNFANSAQIPIYQADGTTRLDNNYDVGLFTQAMELKRASLQPDGSSPSRSVRL